MMFVAQDAAQSRYFL